LRLLLALVWLRMLTQLGLATVVAMVPLGLVALPLAVAQVPATAAEVLVQVLVGVLALAGLATVVAMVPLGLVALPLAVAQVPQRSRKARLLIGLATVVAMVPAAPALTAVLLTPLLLLAVAVVVVVLITATLLLPSLRLRVISRSTLRT